MSACMHICMYMRGINAFLPLEFVLAPGGNVACCCAARLPYVGQPAFAAIRCGGPAKADGGLHRLVVPGRPGWVAPRPTNTSKCSGALSCPRGRRQRGQKLEISGRFWVFFCPRCQRYPVQSLLILWIVTPYNLPWGGLPTRVGSCMKNRERVRGGSEVLQSDQEKSSGSFSG